MSWFRNLREEYLLGFGFICELQTSELKVAEKIKDLPPEFPKEWKQGARAALAWLAEVEASRQATLKVSRVETTELERCADAWEEASDQKSLILREIVAVIKRRTPNGTYL